MHPRIRAILEAASQAPSGENAQPWRFRVDGMTVYLIDDPESDTSLYNFEKRGTLVAQGAAIENMVIAGAAQGLSAEITLFPASEQNCIAALSFASGGISDIPASLATAIPERTTNRKRFKTDPLAPEVVSLLEKGALAYAAQGIGSSRITDRAQITRLAKVGSTNEQIMLGNRHLHSFFFEHLTWTEAEDEQKKVGFYIKTLELPAPIQGLFRVFKHWWLMRFLKSIGFTSLVKQGNAGTNAQAAEFGVLTVANTRPETFISLGRAVERLWLIATSNGLAMQPLTGSIFLNMAASNSRTQGQFDDRERRILSQEVAVLRSLVGGTGDPAFMFRIGYPDAPPSARASRFSVDELLLS